MPNIRKMKNKGALFIEYALILAFVIVAGLVFISNDGMASSIAAIFGKADKTLELAANSDNEGTEALSDTIRKAFKDLDFSKYSMTTEDGSGQYIMASYKGGKKAQDEMKKLAEAFDDEYIKNSGLMEFLGDNYSWRYVGNGTEGYLFLSPNAWQKSTSGTNEPALIMHLSNDNTIDYSVANLYVNNNGNPYIGTDDGTSQTRNLYGAMGQASSTKKVSNVYTSNSYATLNSSTGKYELNGSFNGEGTKFATVEEAIKAYKDVTTK